MITEINLKDALSILFGTIINQLPFYVLAALLMRNHLRAGIKRIVWVITVIMALFYIFALASAYIPERLPPHVVLEVLFVAVLVSGYLFSVRFEVTRLLFALFFVKLYTDTTANTAKYLETTLFSNLEYTIYGMKYNICLLIIIVVTWPLIYYFAERILRPLFRFESKIWNFLWLLPAIYYVTVVIFTKLTEKALNPLNSTEYLALTMLTMFSMILICMLLLQVLNTARKQARLEANMGYINRTLDAQQEQYLELTESIARTRATRHDMRHQLAVLSRYCADGEYEKLEEYIAQLSDLLAPETEVLYCHNYAVNAIVNHYFADCADRGITLDVKFDIPVETGQIKDIDLCIIMGNLLENAVEACGHAEEGKRFIHVRAKIQGNMLIIVVKNSFDGIYQKSKAADGGYISRKRSEEGVGLISVKAICEKYNGFVKIQISEKEWETSVLMESRGI